MLTYWYDAWGEKGNVGDRIAPLVLEYLLGHKVNNCLPTDKGKLLSEGSVAEFIEEGDTVFGSGLIQPMRLLCKRNVNIVMVRGPLTRYELMNVGYDVPECYGTLASLLPEIIPGHENKEYKLGIIPHYVEKNEAKIYQGHFIDVMSDPKDFINEVCKCETVISSSLHGIIIAEAYGVPAVWIQLTNKIIGGDFKFKDYYMSTDRIALKNYHQPIPEIWNVKDAFSQIRKLP